MAASTLVAVAVAATLQTAIVTSDQASLRATPRDSGQQQAQLWQGEMLEVRGERMDYLQVYDHKRERTGFVKAAQVRRLSLAPAEAPELLAVLRFVQERAGSEALGIGLAAAYMKAAPAEALAGPDGISAFDALGTMADRLARRASSGASLSKPQEAALSAQLEVAHHYGINFASYERDGRMTICYDGEAFRRVLAMKSQPEQRARAAIALTRPECADPRLLPLQRAQLNQWRAEVLERVDASALPAWLRNRVQMRRASVYATVAYERTRQSLPADAAAQKALAELAGVSKAELTDIDLPAYNDAAMRVNASRWAALPAVAPAKPVTTRPSPGGCRPGGRNLRAAGRREARREESAGAPLHLFDRLARLRVAQSRRQRTGARGATAGSVAGAVAVPQGWARQLGHQRVAAGHHQPRSRLCRVRGLGARRQAGAGCARGEGRRQVQEELRAAQAADADAATAGAGSGDAGDIRPVAGRGVEGGVGESAVRASSKALCLSAGWTVADATEQLALLAARVLDFVEVLGPQAVLAASHGVRVEALTIFWRRFQGGVLGLCQDRLCLARTQRWELPARRGLLERRAVVEVRRVPS